MFSARLAHGEDLWKTSPLWPEIGGSATQTGRLAPVLAEVTAGGSLQSGYVPPFRAASRDRYAGEVALAAWVDQRVLVGAHWEWLADRPADGEWTTGAGDLRLGTVLYLARMGDLRLYAGWEVKLPNASDEGELGTDETDILFGGEARWDHGPWTADVALGLGILGNPLRFASQDDVPLLRFAGGWQHEWLSLAPSLTVDLDTSRNPARIHLGGEARAGRAVFGYVSGEAGITPADANVAVTAGVGVRGRVDIPARDALPVGGPGA